jgi:hypothetical protein
VAPKFFIGLGVVWLGYSIFYYGFTQVQSGNYGLLDLTLPSRAADLGSISRDGGIDHGTTVGSDTEGVLKRLVEDLIPGGFAASTYETWKGFFSHL